MEASSSAAAAGSVEAAGPQADPLPRKRGEIGYSEDMERRQEEAPQEQSATPLPARHPADRDQPQAGAPRTTSPSTLPSAPNGAPLADDSSAHSAGKRSLISRFKTGKRLGGIRPSSLAICIGQIVLMGGTIVGWVFAAMTVGKQKVTMGDGTDNSTSSTAFNAAIFVHVAFAVITLSQILFLERSIFRLRAERYMHLHPGATLPRSMHLVPSSNSGRLAFAPWNRPPLPTYAAALAESGVGTGDVEDNAIAVDPPPLYGNTRGSMLLLSGYMRTSLRAQAREGRRESQMSEAGDRPLSYMSHDSEWEVVMDAARARRLEQTLSRLEFGQPRNEPPADVSTHASATS